MKTGYLIDMDGVIYRENHLIPGAVEFVDAMLATGTPFLFLTNNSAPTAEDLAVKLKHLGIRELNPRLSLSERHPLNVAAGVPPAVEPGILPGGFSCGLYRCFRTRNPHSGLQDAALHGSQDGCHYMQT